jgi:hypothetical protein
MPVYYLWSRQVKDWKALKKVCTLCSLSKGNTFNEKQNVVFPGKRFRNFGPRQRRQKDVVPESVLKS